MTIYQRIIPLTLLLLTSKIWDTIAAPPEPLDLVFFPKNAKGGKCLDGSPAGFYIRRGSNPNLFVMELEGGGMCLEKNSCGARVNTPFGSSRYWANTLTAGLALHSDCQKNPDFCQATAIYLRYCTGDMHLGSRARSNIISSGYEFHGRLNFMLMVDMLEAEYGLADATGVLMTGGSAGGIGAYFTVDWLSERLPNAVVKAAPRVGKIWERIFHFFLSFDVWT